MTQTFTFVFGYESPEEARANARLGTDMESSGALSIAAESESDALAWGREVAEWYARRTMSDPSYSWKGRGFASWIEHKPDALLLECANDVGLVAVGAYPDFEAMLKAFP